MMHEKEAITLTGVMKNAILQLCRSNLGYAGQLEVDGIICISGEQQGQQIVVKVHEKLFQDTSDIDNKPMNNGDEDELQQYSPYQHYKRQKKINNQDLNYSDEETPSEINKETEKCAEDLTLKGEVKYDHENNDDEEENDDETNCNNDSGINMSYYDQHSSESKLRHLLLANQASKPYSLMPFYQRRAPFPMHSMPLAPECKACGYTFAHTELLREHNEAVHGVFTCNVCYRTFTSRSNLDRHARLHTGHKPYVCSKCGKAFSRKDHLTNHAAKHAFKCGKCLKRFADRDSLKSHYTQEHNSMLSNVCEHCNKGFTDSKVYAEHVKSHPEVSGNKHLIRPRPFSCSDCTFTCSTRLDLLKHRYIHRDVQVVYSCLACSERFGDPVLYSQHFSGHKNDTNVFECCMCRQICKTLQDLKNHEAVHLEVAQKTGAEAAAAASRSDGLICPYCSKVFSSESRLSEHISIHEGYRKVRCGSCDEGFSNLTALRQHEEELAHGPLALVKTPSSSISATEHNHSPTSNATTDAVATETKSEVPVPLVDSDDEPIEVVEPEAPDSPEHDDSQYANDFVIHDNPMPVIELGEKASDSLIESADRNGDNNAMEKENDNDEPTRSTNAEDLTLGASDQPFSLSGSSSLAGLDITGVSPVAGSSGLGSPWPTAADMHNHNFTSAYGSLYCCSICDAQLASFQECEAHCFSEHYRYPCMYCTKTFAQKANRDRHICIHTGEKPFQCPECDQRFARGDKLKIHRMKWHNIQYSTPYMRMPRAPTEEPSGTGTL